jgi:hypothetical protein
MRSCWASSPSCSQSYHPSAGPADSLAGCRFASASHWWCWSSWEA